MRKLSKCFVCLIVVVYGSVFGQEGSSSQKMHELFDLGNAAVNNGEYAKANQAYLEAATYPEAEPWITEIYYAVGQNHSLLGDFDEAFKYLEMAAGAGFSNYYLIKRDTVFALLRESNPERFSSLLAAAKSARMDQIAAKTPLAILEYDNYGGSTEISQWDWEDINSPEFDTLRDRYQLRDIVDSASSEFEQMKLMLNWVATRWRHDGKNMAKDRSALAILKEAEAGKRFCCANYADVTLECMKALGFPARFVGLHADDAGYRMSGGHGCVEVWSNEYQKWLLVDGQNNAWWESQGQPLSGYECHQLFVDGRDDQLDFVGQHEHINYLEMKSSWTGYFHRVIPYWMKTSFQLVSDESTPALVHQKYFLQTEITDDYRRVYPQLNRTRITIKQYKESGSLDTLSIILTHTMPYFDKFMVRINETAWNESNDTIQWALSRGINTIEAKAINLAGVEGKASRIVVLNNLEESED
ncbi:MAG: hypothetical protein JSV52_13155 [Candidatus Zixiibacteriota bacterium]|nr:MAG: hypothetical protein JSV52_13155 [candidate division Zixibacteria bacterium]